MNSNSISVYQAVDEMRKLTNDGKHFSFSFMSYSETKQCSHRMVDVQKARLGKKERIEHNCNAEIMETYVDLLTGEQHRFYKPLIMIFNGQITELT